MRFDRALTLAVHAVRSPRQGPASLPVLMYHSVSAVDDVRRHAYFVTNTRPEVFEDHLRWLRDAGFRTLAMEDVKAFVAGAELARPSVVLTFDDGFADIADTVAPMLGRHGFTASVFLPTAFIGDSRREFLGRACLTWAEVRDLRAGGIEFGSHTVSHPKLAELGHEHRRRELRESAERMARELGEPPTAFSYPFAFPETDASFVADFRELLRDAGYRVAVTTRIGVVESGDDPLTLRRLPVNSADDLRLFAAKMGGAYGWMRLPQRWTKTIKTAMARRRVGARRAKGARPT